MSADQRARLRRAVEIAVYVPLGVVAYARDAAPTVLTILTARGRGELDRRSEQLSGVLRRARSYSDAAIAFGLRRGSFDAEVPEAAVPETTAPPEEGLPPTVPEREIARGRPSAPGLAIPGYDALSASQVVDRLAGLDGGQLDAVRRYEQAHRARRTILGKIDQLTA